MESTTFQGEELVNLATDDAVIEFRRKVSTEH